MGFFFQFCQLFDFKILLVFLVVPATDATKCASPGWPLYGYLNENRSTYAVSEKVTFLCNERYTAADKNYASCRASGTWDSTPPPCALNIGYKAKATVEVQERDKSKGGELMRTSRTLEDLTDENFSTCVNVDRYNGTVIRINLDREYEIAGVKIRFDDTSYTLMDIKVSRVENETVHIETCESINWTRRSSGMIVKCRKPLKGNIIYIYDRLTDGVLLICDVGVFQNPGQNCGTPPQILYGTVRVPSSQNGDTATYECQEHFQLNGPDKPLTCQDGKWRGIPPICKEKNLCPMLHLDSGNVEYSQPGMESFYTYETKATHKCNGGFQLSGHAVRSCLKDGTWSHQSVKCIPSLSDSVAKSQTQRKDGCPLPEYIPNAETIVSGTAVHSLAYYICHGDAQKFAVQCLGDGSWSKIKFQCPEPALNKSGGTSSESAEAVASILTAVLICSVIVGVVGILSSIIIWLRIKTISKIGRGSGVTRNY